MDTLRYLQGAAFLLYSRGPVALRLYGYGPMALRLTVYLYDH